jgi:hypothetical protein
MKNRCQPGNRYHRKGISVCERWYSYENFIEDMGKRPSKNHSIDRKDNNKGYEPSNCRWTDKCTQSLNVGLRSKSKSGIRGVKYDQRKGKYEARANFRGTVHYLYWGPSKFGAIRARVKFNREHEVTV